MLAAVAVTAVNGDNGREPADLEHKQAYEAARAGVEEYAFHLKADSSYWEKCANVPEPERGQPAGLDGEDPQRCPATPGRNTRSN